MTAQDKQKRRAMIEEAATRQTSGQYVTYWVTRDSNADGSLSDTVDVWLTRPERKTLPGGLGAMWICDDIFIPTANGESHARYTTWTLDQCRRACHTVPDTDRECLHVG